MSYQVSQVGQVPVATEIQRQQVRYNPSFRSANVTYLENSPENDVYEKKGMSTGGKLSLSALGALVIVGAADAIWNHGKMRKGLWAKMQNLWNSMRNKADDVVTEGTQKSDDVVQCPKRNKEKLRIFNDNKKRHTEIRRQKKVSKDEVQQAFEDNKPLNIEYGKAPTKQEAIDIAHNNEFTAEATAEARQIGNNAKGVKELKALKAGNPVSKPQAKPVVDAVQQQIKGLEGSIKKLEQRIAGARNMGKNTEKLEAQLTKLQEKLEQLKA